MHVLAFAPISMICVQSHHIVMMSENVACVGLTSKTEVHGEQVSDVALCCRMWQHPNLKMDMMMNDELGALYSYQILIGVKQHKIISQLFLASHQTYLHKKMQIFASMQKSAFFYANMFDGTPENIVTSSVIVSARSILFHDPILKISSTNPV